MKQHITRKQLDELSTAKKKVLYDFFFPTTYRADRAYAYVVDLNPLFITIGQMIEFLGEDYIGALYNHSGNAILLKVKPENICDALWEAVKHELSEVGRVVE